jgi:DNA helicase TIP49 (TBP-interacting protein)
MNQLLESRKTETTRKLRQGTYKAVNSYIDEGVGKLVREVLFIAEVGCRMFGLFE